ncbi:MAG TPA: TIGR03960 family B12-binding radical SAM protein [Spirochaetota bacterium]|nr:TIGR03960 family B12-binding radical SAM protein [Spirochaetota bacterium]HNT12588.1 TIGR03960 family B12-binding radical SAM protein [Spirochaetota bacterium]
MPRLTDTEFNRLLTGVQKPARYAGGELNAIVRERAAVRMAICYPDLYEIGMSNNGIQILYHAANRMEDVACERVFTVEADLEARLRALDLPLFTLETRTPLSELDLLGFSVAHELLATTVLQVLDLGGVPLLRSERGGRDPIVIAGGAGCSNPLPLSDFIDAFFIGDGEEGIIDILSVLKAMRAEGRSRADIIAGLSSIEGVYVPSVHDGTGRTVRKRVYRAAHPLVPERPVVPSIRITQERVALEVTRGCGNLCKYCHAGYYELPYRTYPPDRFRNDIITLLDNTGYEELSLSSLSLGDYRHLAALLNDIMPALTERGVSLSLPSLRVDRATLGIIERLSDIRRSTLTFAVEAAAEDMRLRANKRISTDELVEIIDHVFARGWRAVKLYFMLGMPGCEEHDEAADIAALLKRLLPPGGKKREINVTLSPFIPKPHTPFQRERQMGMDYFDDAVRRIKQSVPRRIAIKNHDIRASTLEGALSRGDARLGRAILAAYRAGCRLDSWKEHFRFDLWRQALDEHAPGWEAYLGPRDETRPLPWEFIATGFERLTDHMTRKIATVAHPRTDAGDVPALDTTAIEQAFARFTRRYATVSRMRLRIEKIGDARLVPHIDFMEIVKRALRMASAPVSFTQGFNKRERISAGFPLPLGVQSVAELIDVDLFEQADPAALAAALNRALPRGISVATARAIHGAESIMAITSAARFIVGIADSAIGDRLTASLAAGRSLVKNGKNGPREVAGADAIIGYGAIAGADCGGDADTATRLLRGSPAIITLTLAVGTELSIRIDDLLRQLSGAAPEDAHLFTMVKTAQLRGSAGTYSEIT